MKTLPSMSRLSLHTRLRKWRERSRKRYLRWKQSGTSCLISPSDNILQDSGSDSSTCAAVERTSGSSLWQPFSFTLLPFISLSWLLCKSSAPLQHCGWKRIKQNDYFSQKQIYQFYLCDCVTIPGILIILTQVVYQWLISSRNHLTT